MAKLLFTAHKGILGRWNCSAQQVVDINGNFESCDEIATKCSLIPNDRSLIEDINFISAVPHHWQLNSVFNNQK